MGVFFSLPFIGFVIGVFGVGVFLTAPLGVELFIESISYRIGLFGAVLVGFIAVAVLARLEFDLNSRLVSFAPKLVISFLGLLIGVAIGFSLSFMNLVFFTQDLT